VLLAAAAVVIAIRPWDGSSSSATGGARSTSIAGIGQGSSGTVPVAGSTAANPNWTAVAAAVQGSVVAIDVQTSSGEALGSGVVVDNKGHVVTNNHVVEGVQGGTVQVTLSDGRLYDAVITGTDASTDLAVVTLKDPPSDLTVAQFGNSDDVKVGDPVMAVGNPLGLANTVTTGIVSAVNRPVSPQTTSGTQGPVTNALQIDAAVNPGNSGGPLFNAQGQVIGITSSIATTSSSSGSIGLGFAIPVKLVQNIAQQIIAHGSAQHAYLGVTLQDGQATADGVTRRGAQVMSVTSSSPASAAGLQAGDVVVAINGQPVGSSDSLAAFVRAMSSGDKATLVLVRNGKSLSVDVTLATKADTSSQNPQGAPSSDPNGTQNGGNQNGNGGSGDGNSMPGNLRNMTPQQMWQWLQQQQGQGSSSGGGAQG
jgi:putative serine protease PepD